MALLTAVLFAGVLAFFTLYYRTNIILGGIALNSLASGGTVFLLYLVANDKGTSVCKIETISVGTSANRLTKSAPTRR